MDLRISLVGDVEGPTRVYYVEYVRQRYRGGGEARGRKGLCKLCKEILDENKIHTFQLWFSKNLPGWVEKQIGWWVDIHNRNVNYKNL